MSINNDDANMGVPLLDPPLLPQDDVDMDAQAAEAAACWFSHSQ